MIREDLDELLDLIEQSEWLGQADTCPSCGADYPVTHRQWRHPHGNDCKLVAALVRYGRRERSNTTAPVATPSASENVPQIAPEGDSEADTDEFEVVESVDQASTYKNVRRAERKEYPVVRRVRPGSRPGLAIEDVYRGVDSYLRGEGAVNEPE